MNQPQANVIRYRLSLYVSDSESIVVKTWYKFEEQASDVEERVCFMQSVPRTSIPAFMKGKRLDRVINVTGGVMVLSLYRTHLTCW